jgi:hypothetical protein
MALAHVSKLFGVNDAAVFEMLTDPAGAAPTYAAKVDVPGVKSMELTLGTDTKELRGDNTLLAADSVLKTISGKVTHGKVGFDIWQALTTATATDSGTTPAQKVSLILSQTDLPTNFKVEGQSKQVDYVGGDIHIVVFKAIPANLLAGFAEEDYREQSFELTAMPLIGTITGGPAAAWIQLVANETAVSIT